MGWWSKFPIKSRLFFHIHERGVFSVYRRSRGRCRASTRVGIGEYALHDLAMLDDGNVGVLTRVEKDVAFVLTNVGAIERPNVKACKLADFKRKMNSRNQTAQDGAMELIDVGSIVRINEGQLKDVNATVEHIYKGTIWVKARGVQRGRAGLSVCDLVSASSTVVKELDKVVPSLVSHLQCNRRLPTRRNRPVTRSSRNPWDSLPKWPTRVAAHTNSQQYNNDDLLFNNAGAENARILWLVSSSPFDEACTRDTKESGRLRTENCTN